MAKKKVIQFAKEVNLTPNQIINLLKGTEFEVKNKNNILYDKAQDFIRDSISKNEIEDYCSNKLEKIESKVDELYNKMSEDTSNDTSNYPIVGELPKELANYFISEDNSSLKESSNSVSIHAHTQEETHSQKNEITPITNHDDLRNCDDLEVLEKTLESKKTEVVVEDIVIKSLEEKVLELTNEIIEIQEKEQEQINYYLNKYENDKKELDEKYIEVQKSYDEKVANLEKDYNDRVSELENSYNQKVQTLKESVDLETKNITELATNTYEEYVSRKQELEDEFENKKNSLEQEYLDRNKILDEEFTKKVNDMEKEFSNRQKAFEEDCEARTAFLEDYEKDVNETCDKKLNDVNAKIKNLKEEFEASMEEQKRLFEEQIRLKDEQRAKEFDELNKKLTDREKEINDDYDKKLMNLKQEELSLVQKEAELNDNIFDFNKKVENFNNEKEKFIDRYYLVKNFKRSLKNNRKSYIIGLVIVFAILSFLFVNFEYTLSKNNFISSSITNRKKDKSYDNTFSIMLDTSESSLSDFTSLDGLNLKLDYKYNNSYYEAYNTYSLDIGKSSYTWERFYKDSSMIMKTPFYGQYVIVSDYKDKGFTHNQGQEVKNFIDAFKQYLAGVGGRNFKECSRLNNTGSAGLIDYLRQIFTIRSDYDYYYSFTDKKHGQKLFENAFKTLLESSNFDSFEKEEAKVQDLLKYSNSLANSQDIFENIVKYSKVTNTTTNVKIGVGNKISTIDVTFDLDYQDSSMINPVPMKIRFSCNFNDLENDESLEKDAMSLNATFIESLSN